MLKLTKPSPNRESFSKTSSPGFHQKSKNTPTVATEITSVILQQRQNHDRRQIHAANSLTVHSSPSLTNRYWCKLFPVIHSLPRTSFVNHSQFSYLGRKTTPMPSGLALTCSGTNRAPLPRHPCSSPATRALPANFAPPHEPAKNSVQTDHTLRT